MAQTGSLLGKPILVLTRKLDALLPDSIRRSMSTVAVIGKIVGILHEPLVYKYRIITQNQYSYFTAPVTKEVIFRLVIQEGSSLALQKVGIPPTIVKVTTIAITSFLFGMTHNEDITHEEFASIALQGVAFGVMQSENGTLAAVFAHGLSNWIMDIRSKLNI